MNTMYYYMDIDKNHHNVKKNIYTLFYKRVIANIMLLIIIITNGG